MFGVFSDPLKQNDIFTIHDIGSKHYLLYRINYNMYVTSFVVQCSSIHTIVPNVKPDTILLHSEVEL